jgi:hypothetical protein
MRADNTGWSSGARWTVALASPVVAVVVIWLLNQDGGPTSPKPPPTPPEAIVSVSDMDTAVYTRRGSDVAFTITNDGDGVANGCHIRGNTRNPVEFSIPAHRSVAVSEPIYAARTGVQTLSYNVVCENARSTAVSKAVHIAER